MGDYTRKLESVKAYQWAETDATIVFTPGLEIVYNDVQQTYHLNSTAGPWMHDTDWAVLDVFGVATRMTNANFILTYE